MRTKKKLFAAALAICLLSTISFSTLAWFNASESVTNKFMVASTGTGESGQTQPDKIFSLDLWEKVKVDEDNDGVLEDKKVSYRDDPTIEWNYNDILPGVEYHKEPFVENTGSYDQWVRVLVTVTDASEWESILGTGYPLDTIFKNFDPSLWSRGEIIQKATADGGEYTYVYYLNKVLPYPAKDDTVDDDHMVSLFTAVELPGSLTQDEVAQLVDADGSVDFDIIIRADAIQTSLAENAKDAFAAIGWTAEKSYEQAMASTPTP